MTLESEFGGFAGALVLFTCFGITQENPGRSHKNDSRD